MHDDWLERYIHFTRHQASPILFHRWAGIAVLGAALERRVWLTRGYERLRLYPGQLMVVLVGKSALEKKTTACDFATDLLTHLPPWQLQVLPKKTSPQRLLRLLERVDDDGLAMRYPEGHPRAGRRVNSAGFINAGELSVFFSTDAFNEMLAATINDVNDAKSGKVKVEFQSWQATLWNPLVGMLGAITPKGIATELPKAARTAGFFGRILWVHSRGGARPNALVDRIVEEKREKEILRAGITAMAQTYGPFTFTKQGKAWFKSWHDDVYVRQLEQLDAQALLDSTGYWGRKDGHLLRVAMVCAASRSWGGERWLRRVDLERALKYLEEIERGFPEAMAEIGIGPHAEENARLLGFMEKKAAANRHGWVSEREVARYGNSMGMRKHHVDDALARLQASGDLQRGIWGGKAAWRRVWTQGALMRRAGEEKVLDTGMA